MPNRDEQRAIQTTTLFELLALKQRNDKHGQKVLGLENAIARAMAPMTEPDIAWVEKQIARRVDD